MDNNIYKLLDYMSTPGVGIECDIANPLREIFVVTDTTHHSTVHTASILQRFLDYLIADNLIHMTARPDKSLGERHDTQGFRWLVGDWPIGAAITLKGYDYLAAEKARQTGSDLESSIINTNRSVADTNTATKKLYDETIPNSFKSQNRQGWRTFWLGVISAFFIGITVWKELTDKTQEKLKELNTTMQENKKQIEQLNTSLQNVENAIRQQPDSIRVKILKK